MAKRNKFEEILDAEFRWPQAGDNPFTASDDWTQNATIAQDKFSRLVLMMEGYKKAADLMVEQSIASRADRDFLVFPIIFNYRQFLELSLKYHLYTYGTAVDVAPNWRTHDLSVLWSEFAILIGRYGTPDPDEADPIVSEVVAEFSKIDPQSFSHRYPVDTRGNPIPLEHELLDLARLSDVMQGVANYFTGADGLLDSLASA